jgi:RHS repeat-associated protein
MKTKDDNNSQNSFSNTGKAENNNSNVSSPQGSSSRSSAPDTNAGTGDSKQAKINLPTGGGAIRGIGEKFEANPVTGTASFSVPLTISEGRGGFTPQLALSYDSGSGNSIFGLGWSVGLPSITRKTDKGLPQYNDNADHESDTFILSGAEDLVPVLDNGGKQQYKTLTDDETTYKVYSYRPRIEGLFAVIERWVNQDTKISHWRSISKENITSIFGLTQQARISDLQNERKIFSWLLEESWDAKGNLMQFSYKQENSLNVEDNCFEVHRLKKSTSTVYFPNRYLKKVSYGNKNMCTPSFCQSNYTDGFYFDLVFDYGEENNIPLTPFQEGIASEQSEWAARKDAFSNYKAGFEIRTYRLCQKVLMYHSIESDTPELVKSTELHYDTTKAFTLLKKVIHCGHDDAEKAEMPALEFSYSEAIVGEKMEQVDESQLRNLPAGVDGQNYQWADLYSEGISGILKQDNNAWYFMPNYGEQADENTSEQGNERTNSTVIARTTAKTNNAVIARNEAISNPDRHSERSFSGVVESLTQEQADSTATLGMTKEGVRFGGMRSEIPKPAAIRGRNTGFRLDDVDSDGLPELVIEAKGQNGFYSRDEDGKWLNFRNFKEFPNVDFNDNNLRYMDLSGDGLSDIVISKGEYFDIYFSEGKTGYGNYRRVRCSNESGAAPVIVFSDPKKRIFLADMSGDGLTDIVRITHSSICYYPNLGYGRFGEKVVMSTPPLLDSQEAFDARFVHLADVDGTGTTDLVYISKHKIRYYKNLSGNAWEEEVLNDTLSMNATQQTFIQTTDLLGNGTQCLVFSSSLPQKSKQMWYWELTSGIKPFLLNRIVNNMGGVTRLHYTSSTKFYIQDKLGGTPWITRLPFAVHVLEKTEIIDWVANTYFTTRYAYHHGFYDHSEREFRGFGMVEQWDCEQLKIENGELKMENASAAIARDEAISNPDRHSERSNSGVVESLTEEQTDSTAALGMTNTQSPPLGDLGGFYVPPVYTKTWFHTGFYKNRGRISRQFEEEYYQGDANAWKLPDTVFPDGLNGQEAREACRALKGSPLRIEIYALDGSDKETIPYTVEEKSYHLQCLQHKGENAHAVFLKTDGETLAYHYERYVDDPRIIHSLVLETDEYGNPKQQAEIAYPRRDGSGSEEQQKMLCTSTFTEYINTSDGNMHLIGIPFHVLQFETHNLVSHDGGKWTTENLLNSINNASDIDYAATPDTTEVQRRIIQHTFKTFWNEDCSEMLSFGEISPQALPCQQFSREFTRELINQLNQEGEKINENLLQEEGKYMEGFDCWYAVSDIQYFDNHLFYLPVQTIDPWGNVTTTQYDNYGLFPQSITDPLHNDTIILADYRTLQLYAYMTPNGMVEMVYFDTLGLVKCKYSVDFKNAGDFSEEYPDEIYEYDLHCWKDEQKPVYAHVKRREIWQDPQSRFLESYVYTDGLGNEIMAKANVADGLAWTTSPNPSEGGGQAPSNSPEGGEPIQVQSTNRWLASGKTILNNKGLAVRQYEPWFSDNPDYEFDDRLSMYGVTPVMHYDPLGRLIQTDLPDGTTTKVEFDVWQQKNYDQNDCDINSLHYNTPQILDMDVLGRVFQTTDLLTSPPAPSPPPPSGLPPKGEEEGKELFGGGAIPTSAVIPNGASAEWWNLLQNRDANPNIVTTHNKLDITGRILTVTDALNREATQNRFGLSEQNQVYVENIDSGKRCLLNDTAGKPIRKWDEREHEFAFTYDELQRLTETNVNNICVERIEYGTEFEINSIGQIRHIYAQDGKTSFEYDYKGNIVKQEKQFAQDYQNELDWNTNPTLINETFIQETTYDALNRPVSLINPDNKTTFYTYDKGGLLVTVQVDTDSPYIDNIEYNEKQQRLAVYYGNNTKTKYEYNPLNFRLTRILTTRNTGNDALQDLNYEYDAVGNIIQQTDNAQQTFYFNNQVIAPIGTYEYDALYRLVKAEDRELTSLTAPNQDDFSNDIPCPNPAANAMQNYTHNYQYDKLGNMLQDAWKSYQYATENNYLLGNNNIANQYTYDTHGNMLTMPHLSSLDWDYLDQLHSATNGTFVSYYNYDAEGNRTRKVVVKGNVREERYYIGGYEIYRKYTNNSLDFERTTLNISDDEKVFVRIEQKTNENEIVRYQYDNHLGSACLELDANALIISYEEYHPFGTTSYRSGRNEVEVSLKRYKYCGKERDEETGLYYYGMRYYAAWICRFVSVDPLQFEYPYYTPYQYAGNKPISFIDLDGAEEADPKTGKITGNVYFKLDDDMITDKSGDDAELLSNYITAFKENVNNVWNSLTLADGTPVDVTGVNFLPFIEGTTELETNDFLLTVGNRGSSNPDTIHGRSYIDFDRKTGYMYHNKNAEEAAHEFGHIMGLSDRYANVMQYDPYVKDIGYTLSDAGFVPLVLKGEKDYNPLTNLMSGAGTSLTQKQLSIVFNNRRTEKSHSTPVVLTVNPNSDSFPNAIGVKGRGVNFSVTRYYLDNGMLEKGNDAIEWAAKKGEQKNTNSSKYPSYFNTKSWEDIRLRTR